MAQAPSNTGFSEFKQSDLTDDKTLWKLNLTFRQLWEKIGTFFAPGSTPTYPSTPTFTTVKASSQAIPPDDPNEFITRGNADKLYSAAVQRAALLTGVNPAAQFNPALSGVTQPLPSSASSIISDILRYGTHANRPLAAGIGAGTLYEETDRNSLYQNQIVANVETWVWIAGEMRATQATLPADLGTSDTGFIAQVTDFNHRLKWSGSAWGWAPGDNGSGFIQGFLVDPDPTTGWVLADGSTVTYLKKDGTTTTQALPDLVSAGNKAAYLKFGSPASATVNAAVAPVLTMNSYTPAGTVSAPVFTGNSLTPSGTNSTPTFTGNAATPTGTISAIAATATAAVLVTTSGAVQVAAQAHTHAAPSFTGNTATPTGSVSAPTFTGNAVTPSGTNSAPTFTGTAAVLTGTIDTTGQPQNVVLRPWFKV